MTICINTTIVCRKKTVKNKSINGNIENEL